MGHVVPGVLWQAGPLELDGGVGDVKVGLRAAPGCSSGFFHFPPCACPECRRGKRAPEDRSRSSRCGYRVLPELPWCLESSAPRTPGAFPLATPRAKRFPPPAKDHWWTTARERRWPGRSPGPATARRSFESQWRPTRMPIFEIASPKLCRSKLRRLRSRRLRTSASVIPPLIASASSETPIIHFHERQPDDESARTPHRKDPAPPKSKEWHW